MEQRVSGPKVKPWQGIVLVVSVAVFLFLAQFIMTFLQYTLASLQILGRQTAYTVASVAYWLVGGIVALIFVRKYVMNYLYTVNTKVLHIERVYGPGKPRYVEDVYFSGLRALGTPQELKARYPSAKTIKAVHTRETLDTRAVAYETSDGTKLLLFQPNEEMWSWLQDALKKNKK